ncbi:proton channel OTOP2-like [Spea bombifrons]|uniref:proton channel OTOP2-like n=1 Tax=Spea bombifrons TaxID=233779 RepID=UPI00234A5F0F|nr:proton channel OTOP2-like [Spea bombifrons]
MGSSCGPLMVSVFSLVAIFFLHIEGNLYILDLCFSLSKTIQVLGQNLFITEALYSGPTKNKSGTSRAWIYSISQDPAMEIIQHVVSNKSSVEGSRRSFSEKETSVRSSKILIDLEKDEPRNLKAGSSLIDMSSKRECLKKGGKQSCFRTRRKILQNISILLICYNISVWILYAYGTRPHLVSQIEQSFYGFTLWVIIVKISLPLGIFYRMHSVASLFEAYCNICEAAAC